MSEASWGSRPEAGAAAPFLPDDLLLARLGRLVARERACTAELVGYLAEVDVRKLYLGLGCASLFTYCTEMLGFSEDAACARIAAARAARRYPEILLYLADGSLHLTALRLLTPLLSRPNGRRVLEAARHRSGRQIEELIAQENPRPNLSTIVRRVPQERSLELQPLRWPEPVEPAESVKAADPSDPSDPSAPSEPSAASESPGPTEPVHLSEPVRQGDVFAPAWTRRAAETRSTHGPHSAPASHAASCAAQTHAGGRPNLEAVAPRRYRLHVTLSEATRDRLRRAQDLLRHRVPDGDISEILDLALTGLVERLERRRFGVSPAQPASSDPVGPRARRPRETRELPETGDVQLAHEATTPRESGESGESGEPSEARDAGEARVNPAEHASLDATRGGNARAVSRSRHIPLPVRREVLERDRRRCAFVSVSGRRCSATSFLEIHHVKPWARGGPSSATNLELRCRAHNGLEADRAMLVRPGIPVGLAPP